MRQLPGQRPTSAQPSQQQQQATNVQPIRQQPAAQQQAPARRAPGGPGLPPPPADFDPSKGGGGFEKRDDDYWEAHPLRVGEYDFDASVNKIKWWGPDGYKVGFRVIDWDQDAGRPGAHHGRGVDWQQSMTASKMHEWLTPEQFGKEASDKAGRAYGHFRSKLVAAYVALGLPEDKWPRDEHGSPAPPFDDFFVHRLANGLSVPVALRLHVAVEKGRESWPEVRSVEIIRTEKGVPFEALMPFEVPRFVADMHRWVVNETKSYVVNGKTAKNGYRYDSYTVETCRLNQIEVGGVGLPTYKDL